MTRLELEDVQRAGLDILLHVDRALKSLGIQYILDFGTLLGACRHGGFIPWDDDIDVSMSVRDMDLFLREGPKLLPSHLSIARHPFAGVIKVEDNRYWIHARTHLRGGGETETHLAIDIFPIRQFRSWSRFLPTAKVGKFIAVRGDAEARSKHLKQNGELLRAGILRAIGAVPTGFDERFTRLVASDDHWAPKGRSKLGHGLGSGFAPEFYESSTVFPLQSITFEGHEFLAPHDTDAYLTKLYGDWRQLPPADKRHPHHFLQGWYRPPNESDAPALPNATDY